MEPKHVPPAQLSSQSSSQRSADDPHASATAGLPRHLLPSRVLICGVAAAVFLVYLAGAAPCTWWGDGLELACAAWTLGIPHPTGYPLYVLTGHAWMKLLVAGGLDDPGHALTLYSAALLAAASGGVMLLLHRRLLEVPARPGDPIRCDCGMAALLPAVGIGLLVAFSYTVRDHATFAEVYPLTLFLGVIVIHLAWRSVNRTPGAGWAALFGLTCGVGALNHYSIIALAPLALLTMLAWTRGLPAPRRSHHGLILWMGFFAGLLCGLAGYLYLPLRAAANPPLNWGDPSTPERLAWVLSGGQFRELKVGGASPIPGLINWLAWWGRQWLPSSWNLPPVYLLGGLLALGIAIFGLLRLALHHWHVGWGLLASIFVTALFAAVYRIPDIDAYFMIALPAAAVGWLAAGQAVLSRARRSGPGFMRSPAARALPVVAALAVLLMHQQRVDKSWDDSPLVWGEAALKSLPENAIVITEGDSDIYALWYQQMVLGRRPDVSVIGSQFIFSGWYARYFESTGRPRIAMCAEDRKPGHKLDFDVALFNWVLLPNLRDGLPVYATLRDPLIDEYLSPQVASPELLPAMYYEVTAYPFGPAPPILIHLRPNPRLAALDETALRREFSKHYGGAM